LIAQDIRASVEIEEEWGGTKGRLAVDGGIAEPRVNDDPAEASSRRSPM